MSFFGGRRRAKDVQIAADALHDALVATIRQPVFYLAGGVPDTFEGRFDLLVLHAGLVLRRLRSLDQEGQAIAQHLVDTMFARFDIAMRELGVGDITVPKRMKRLAEGFKGRTASYDEALNAQDEAALAAAISRNILNQQGDGKAFARYALAADAILGTTDLAVLRVGLPALPDPARLL